MIGNSSQISLGYGLVEYQNLVDQVTHGSGAASVAIVTDVHRTIVGPVIGVIVIAVVVVRIEGHATILGLQVVYLEILEVEGHLDLMVLTVYSDGDVHPSAQVVIGHVEVVGYLLAGEVEYAADVVLVLIPNEHEAQVLGTPALVCQQADLAVVGCTVEPHACGEATGTGLPLITKGDTAGGGGGQCGALHSLVP